MREVIELDSVIDYSSVIPYYYQLASILEDKINNGDLPVGSKLPAQEEICKEYNISRTVVRQALQNLEEKGLIIRSKGRKTIVRAKITQDTGQRFHGFHYEMSHIQNHHVKTKLLEKTFEDNLEKFNILFKSKIKEVLKIVRIRYLDEEPAVLTITYLPYRMAALIEDIDFGQTSLYDFLRNKHNIEPVASDTNVEATVADNEIAKLLKIKKNTPLFYLKTTTYQIDHTVLDYSISWHRGDRFNLKIFSKKNQETEFNINYNT